jgi:hypothetical protein
MRQLKLNLEKGRWGGRRKNSGRKRIHSPGVSHKTREKVTRRYPVHINIKYATKIKNTSFLQILKRGILNAQKKGMRIIHYSVQFNHIHFIIEADNNEILFSGMRSMTVTLTRGIGKGKIQIQPYHLHVLKTPQETLNARNYVVFNEQKHIGKRSIDSYSSVGIVLNLRFDYCVTPLDKPQSWLLLNSPRY